MQGTAKTALPIRPFQGASCQSPIRFHVVNYRTAFTLPPDFGIYMRFLAIIRQKDTSTTLATLWTTVLTAVGTSPDAMAIGM